MSLIIAHLVEMRSDLSEVAQFSASVSDLTTWCEAEHVPARVGRARWSAPRLPGEIVVSHLQLGWSRLPLLVGLRARYPKATMIHLAQAGEWGGNPECLGSGASRADLLRSCLALFDLVMTSDANGATALADARLVDETFAWSGPTPRADEAA